LQKVVATLTGTGRSRLALLVVLVAVWSTAATAGAPRLLALGGDGAYLEDSRGVLRWYGTLVDYAGMATVESGYFNEDGYLRYPDGLNRFRTSGPAAGVHVALGGEHPAAVVGLWLANAGDDTEPGTLYQDRLATTGTLLVARDFGSLSLGLGWRHGSADETGTAAIGGTELATARDVTRDDLGLGARFGLGTDAYLDLAGEWRSVSVRTLEPRSNATTVDSGDLSSTDNWAVRSRGFVALGETTVLVPVGEYLREDRPGAYRTGASTWLDGWAWRLGCGFTWLPDPDRLVLVSAEHRQARKDVGHWAPEYESVTRFESAIWAARAAAEIRAGAFWTVRAAFGWEGGKTEWHDPAVSDPPQRQDLGLFPLSVGLALHAGGWDLDLGIASHRPTWAEGIHFSNGDEGNWLNAGFTYSF
jgi:hypothetical protein